MQPQQTQGGAPDPVAQIRARTIRQRLIDTETNHADESRLRDLYLQIEAAFSEKATDYQLIVLSSLQKRTELLVIDQQSYLVFDLGHSRSLFRFRQMSLLQQRPLLAWLTAVIGLAKSLFVHLEDETAFQLMNFAHQRLFDVSQYEGQDEVANPQRPLFEMLGPMSSICEAFVYGHEHGHVMHETSELMSRLRQHHTAAISGQEDLSKVMEIVYAARGIPAEARFRTERYVADTALECACDFVGLVSAIRTGEKLNIRSDLVLDLISQLIVFSEINRSIEEVAINLLELQAPWIIRSPTRAFTARMRGLFFNYKLLGGTGTGLERFLNYRPNLVDDSQVEADAYAFLDHAVYNVNIALGPVELMLQAGGNPSPAFMSDYLYDRDYLDLDVHPVIGGIVSAFYEVIRYLQRQDSAGSSIGNVYREKAQGLPVRDIPMLFDEPVRQFQKWVKWPF